MSLGKIAVIGDSYSTFKGIIPKEFAAYYGADLRPEHKVCSPHDTWWQIVADKTNSEILFNCSFSGSTICYTTYNNVHSPSTSFIGRTKSHLSKYFNEIDTIFIFGGTNDSWAGSPLGNLKFENITEEDLNSILPATCYLLDYLKQNCPKTKIYILTNDTFFKPELINGIKDAAKHYNAQCIQIANISLLNEHPDFKGMNQIAEIILNYLNK